MKIRHTHGCHRKNRKSREYAHVYLDVVPYFLMRQSAHSATPIISIVRGKGRSKPNPQSANQAPRTRPVPSVVRGLSSKANSRAPKNTRTPSFPKHQHFFSVK